MSTPNAATLAFLASVVLLAVLLVATGYLLARRSSGAGWAVGRRQGSTGRASPGRAASTGPAARAEATATATATRPVPTGPPPRPRAAVVVNPTKFDDLEGLRQSVDAVLEQQGWAPGRWLETTADDPGQGPAHQALEEGMDLVLACGGDGTVRAVAEALAGTGRPLGLLPGGTGNLLARNLDVDVTDIPESARLTVTGVERPVDVGRLVMDGSGQEQRPAEHVFCVMAGLGFDAQIMANAPEALKARVGWFAYVLSGVRLLKGQSSRVQLRVDGGPPLRRRVRTVVVGNCGRLTGGLVLMPDARVDDGWLDVVSIAPAGLGGWLAVAVRVLTRTRRGHRRVEHFRCREVTITCERPEQVQVDGDPIGAARVLRIAVQRDALLLRVPAAAVPGE